MEVIGWLGAVCFAACGIPQAYNSWKHGNSFGISPTFLLLWGMGEVLTLIYVIPKQQWPIIFNLLSNLFFILVIVYYKIWPRKQKYKSEDDIVITTSTRTTSQISTTEQSDQTPSESSSTNESQTM